MKKFTITVELQATDLYMLQLMDKIVNTPDFGKGFNMINAQVFDAKGKPLINKFYKKVRD